MNCSFLKFIFVVLFAFCCSESIHSQTNKKDSLRLKLTSDSAHIYRVAKILPIIRIDQRNSFLGKTKVNVGGIQIGIKLYEKHEMGLGFYSIKDETKRSKVIGEQKQNRIQHLELNYMTAFYYYPIVDRKHFEFGFPVEAGLGSYSLNVTDSVGRPVLGYPKPRRGILVLGTGINMSYKPIRWMGINFMSGYRVVKDNSARLNFNGIFYSLGLELYLHEVIQDTRYGIKKLRYKRKLRHL